MTVRKSAKRSPKGASVDEKDAKEIIAGVQAMYDKIPSFIRGMLSALPTL